MLPPNSTSVIQLLDQGIIMSVKRRYKKKLAERYLVSVENNKDANALLKQLDIVAAINMVHNAWKETPSSIIQNCFCKACFKHFNVDPEPVPEEPPIAPAPEVWNKVQKWMGDMQFNEFVAMEPEAATTQIMMDEEIVDLVHTENDAQEQESEDEEEETPPVKSIKNASEFLAIIDQQRAFLKRNGLPVELVEQLEKLLVDKQVSLCSKQKEVTHYFKSFSQSPKPKDRFKSLSDVSADITIVDSLSKSALEMELDSINTTIASGTMNTLMSAVTPGRTSTPKPNRPDMVDPSTTNKKKLKLSGAAVREKVMAINDSDISSLETESDTQLILSLQE